MSDEEPIELARGGNRAACGELVERHQQAVFRTALAALRSREEAESLPSQSAALVPVESPSPGMPLATRQGRRLPGTREIAGLGTASLAGREDEPVGALQGAEPTLPGAPVGSPGEPIPAMPAPPPVVIPAIAPAPIVVVPSVEDLGRPLGIPPIAEPARVITIIEKNRVQKVEIKATILR